MMTPASPSMMIQSSWRTNWLQVRAPTTAGMSILRATIAVCDVLPPTSVINPANPLCLNCSMSAGDRSCATNTKGTSTVSPKSRSCCIGLRVERPVDATTGEATPFIARKIRSTICSRSALRSRRYSSSISSKWRAMISSCVVSAHSALYNLSEIHPFTPLINSASCSSIRCTSNNALNSWGASLGPMCVILVCRRWSSSITASRPRRTRSISASTSLAAIK